MIVPRFWAESRIQKRFSDRQITVRRFGWSSDSERAAELHAQSRVREAFEAIVAGDNLARREKKVGYAGSDGLPIREEIIEEVGENVVTRNSYGARCLNSPNVFIADIDLVEPRDSISCVNSVLSIGLAVIFSIALANVVNLSVWQTLLICISCIFVCSHVVTVVRLIGVRLAGGREKIALRRIGNFIEQHPSWHLRLYRSPNGFRLIALHELLEPRSEEVVDAFKKLSVDKTYSIMCQKQDCFRARLTAKPWRIGVSDHLRPRPGVWPIKDKYLPNRRAWVENYESLASEFAACHFIEAIGSTHRVDRIAKQLCEYHDAQCRAFSDAPAA